VENASKIICRGRASQIFEFVKLILLMKMYGGMVICGVVFLSHDPFVAPNT
jgi:hypothetical protein